MRQKSNQTGFTLIELLVAMAVSSIFLGGVLSIFRLTQMSGITQQQVMNMQQNLRAAFTFMGEEIREMGYSNTAKAEDRDLYRTSKAILYADNTKIQFQIDRNGNGDTDTSVTDPQERVSYYIFNGNLVRQDFNNTPAIVAEHIDALNFRYLDWAGKVISPGTAGFTGKIRGLQITMVARSNDKNPGFMFSTTDKNKYTNIRTMSDPAQIILDKSASPDNFRRLCFKTEVFCRNLAMEDNFRLDRNPVNP